MKKIILPVLFVTVTISASDYNYEVTPVVGYVIPRSEHLGNHPVYGGEFKYNSVVSHLKPELSILWSNADYEDVKPDTIDIFRMAVNGVYDFTTINNVVPFAKAGLGYEHINNNENGTENFIHNGLFTDVGAGLKVGITNQITLKFEAIEMLKFNNFDWDNSLLLMAGINFSFNEKLVPVAIAIEKIKEFVAASPAVAIKQAPVAVAIALKQAPAAVAPIGDEKDHIFSSSKKCTNIPKGLKVDADGCPLKVKLYLNFASNSNKLDAEGAAKIAAFSIFMKKNLSYKASIVGHTDRTASDKYNQTLSEKRASIVKDRFIHDGIAPDRLTSSGKGEIAPLVSNETKAGRAENRRIEIEFKD